MTSATKEIPAGRGGSYTVNDSGDVTQTERPTQDHPDGNRARDEHGAALDLPAPTSEEKPKAPKRREPLIAALAGD